MSKTYKDILNLFDASAVKKRGGEASARFKTEQRHNKTAKRTRSTRADDRLFKHEVRFVSWLERTASED
jgi:hypothetical protein